MACSNTPHAESRSRWRISGSAGFQRGRIEKPLWRAAPTRIATKAMTPPVPAITNNIRSVDDSTRVGSEPATTWKAMSAATMTTVLPIGAAAVMANRRRA